MSRVAYRYTTMGWLVVSVLVLGAVAGTGAQRAFDDLAPIAVVASPAPKRGGLNDDSALEVHARCVDGSPTSPGRFNATFAVPYVALSDEDAEDGFRAELLISAQASRRGPPIGAVAVLMGSRQIARLDGFSSDRRGVWRAATLDVTEAVKTLAATEGGEDTPEGATFEATFTFAPPERAPCDARAQIEGAAEWTPPARRLRLRVARGGVDGLDPDRSRFNRPKSALPVPRVVLTDRPTNAREAVVAFDAEGAGVAGFRCMHASSPDLSTPPAAWAACASPHRVGDGDLSDGSHALRVVAVDAEGRVGRPATATWHVDATPPALSFATRPPDETADVDAVFDVYDADHAREGSSAKSLAWTACSLDGAVAKRCHFPARLTGLTRGVEHVFTVTAADAAGNQATVEARWTVTGDSPEDEPSSSSAAAADGAEDGERAVARVTSVSAPGIGGEASSGPFEVIVGWSSAVTGLSAGGLDASGGDVAVDVEALFDASDVGTLFRFLVTPLGVGVASIAVGPGAAVDAATRERTPASGGVSATVEVAAPVVYAVDAGVGGVRRLALRSAARGDQSADQSGSTVADVASGGGAAGEIALAADANGALFAASSGRVLVYPKPGSSTSPAFTVDGFGEVGGVAVPARGKVPAGLVYVSVPDEGRVTLLARDGSTLAETKDLRRPTAVVSDGAGRVYVADADAGEMVVFGVPDATTRTLPRVGTLRHPALGGGPAGGQRVPVRALETTPAGFVLVAVANRPGILALDARQTTSSEEDGSGSGSGSDTDAAWIEIGSETDDEPVGLALDAAGELHVATAGGAVASFALPNSLEYRYKDAAAFAAAVRRLRTTSVAGASRLRGLAAPRLRAAPSATLTLVEPTWHQDDGHVDAFGHAAGAGSPPVGSGPFDVRVEWDVPVRGFGVAGVLVRSPGSDRASSSNLGTPDDKWVGSSSSGASVTSLRAASEDGRAYLATVEPPPEGGLVEVSLAVGAAIGVADGAASVETLAHDPLTVFRSPPACAASHGCGYRLAEFEDALASQREARTAKARREEALEAVEAKARADRETARINAETESKAAAARAAAIAAADLAATEKRLAAEAEANAAERAANAAARLAELAAETEAATARANAEATARVREAEETEQINLRRVAAEGAAKRAAYIGAVTSAAASLGEGVASLLTQPRRAAAAVAIAGATFAAYFVAKEAAALTRDVVDRLLRTPALVKERRRGGGLRSRASDDPFSDVVAGDALRLRLRSIAAATAGAKRWRAPFRHVLFHGPPGTGKTMAAERLARRCGLDYAIMSGGDVAPLGRKAVTQLHRVFDWALRSRRGVLLFIDEADAFLRRREDDAMGEEMRSALNALLHRTGTPSTTFCLVLASNRPEDLDDAVLDRMDELVEFPLPGAVERAGILRAHVDAALGSRGVDTTEVTPEVIHEAARRAVGFSGRELAKVAASVQGVVYGEAEERRGVDSKGMTMPRLTSEALLRVVEWKVREHREKEEMKRIGSARHLPVGGTEGFAGDADRDRASANGSAGTNGIHGVNGVKMRRNDAFQPEANGRRNGA